MPTARPSPDAPFIDIRNGIALAQAIVDTVRDPLLVLDQNLRILAASRPFYQTFQLQAAQVFGRLLYEIDGGQWSLPELRGLLETIARDRSTIEGYEVDGAFPRIGRRVMLLNARQVFYEQEGQSTILLAFEDVTVRRAADRRVAELLEEKDMLLQEMQHRVANSLQIIASILLIKARIVQSEETRLHLQDAHQRVLSVAAVQRHLNPSSRGEPIEIADYLRKLCASLAQSMIGDSRPITLTVEADTATLSAHRAVSLGLIVTELVMNILKHAFPTAKPDAAIVVSYRTADTDWKLTVADNGVGKPDALTITPGLGTTLVQALAKQLDARLDIESDGHGTAVLAEPRHLPLEDARRRRTGRLGHRRAGCRGTVGHRQCRQRSAQGVVKRTSTVIPRKASAEPT